LPQILIEFIKTHHGTTKVEYFLRNQKNEEPDRNFDESLFEYPGPKPSSKEQTILMLADSIEASSKSLKNPTGVDIDQLIDNIIQFKISKNQLTNSDLSFSELQKCTDVFKSLLRSIYHVRVEYPAEKKAE
jgi:membrane-associated HD superfamily phosphohydrolase